MAGPTRQLLRSAVTPRSRQPRFRSPCPLALWSARSTSGRTTQTAGHSPATKSSSPIRAHSRENKRLSLTAPQPVYSRPAALTSRSRPLLRAACGGQRVKTRLGTSTSWAFTLTRARSGRVLRAPPARFLRPALRPAPRAAQGPTRTRARRHAHIAAPASSRPRAPARAPPVPLAQQMAASRVVAW